MSGPPAFLSEDSTNESFPGSGPETLSCPHSKSIEGGTDLATGRFHASISGTMMAFNVTRGRIFFPLHITGDWPTRSSSYV